MSLLHGVYPVVATPFMDSGELDLDGAAALGRWLARAGVDGIVCNGNASEATAMTIAERKQVAEQLRETVPGLPLVVGVSTTGFADSLDLARHAASIGAAATMSVPPFPMPLGDPEVEAYYLEVARGSGIPLVIQDTTPPVGRPLGVHLIGQIAQAEPLLLYVKEEAFDSAHKLGSLTESTTLTAVGGEGGRHHFNQGRRGASGIMPASSLPEAYAALWLAGDGERARDIYAALLPLVVMSDSLGPRLHKEILVRRGVIASPAVRVGSWPRLDSGDRAEIEIWLGRLDALVPPVAVH